MPYHAKRNRHGPKYGANIHDDSTIWQTFQVVEESNSQVHGTPNVDINLLVCLSEVELIYIKRSLYSTMQQSASYSSTQTTKVSSTILFETGLRNTYALLITQSISECSLSTFLTTPGISATLPVSRT